MKSSLPRLFSGLVTGLLLGLPACSTAEPAKANYGEISMYVARALQDNHYTRRDFDDEISRRMLTHYLNTLDYNHVYFFQTDVDSFKAKYETKLDDMVLTGDIAAAGEIYSIFKTRVKDRVAKISKLLKDEKFTFDATETVDISRKKLAWPKDEAAADDLWRRMVKSEMLQEELNKKLKEEKAKEAAEKKAADPKKDEKKDEKKDAAPKKTPPPPEPADQKISKRYDRFLKSLNENDDEEIANFFLSALSLSYDPHSEYFSQSELENFKIGMNNSLVGIGALLQKKDDGVEIQGIVLGGPADKGKELKEKDKIIGVAQGQDGKFEDVRDLKLQKIVDMIRGEKGSLVRLQVVPNSDPGSVHEILIVRDNVDLKDKLANAQLIESKGANGQPAKIGWMTIPSFYADMEDHTTSLTKDTRKLLDRLIKENINGLVIDLRGNGGGSLEEAISMTGLFIKRGPVVQAKDWRGDIDFRRSPAAEPVYNGPLVVVTDKTSASASEIFAAALQDYGRAVIVGDESSFGKGTVQTIMSMKQAMPFFSDSKYAGALKVTIQKFYRIAGGSTQFKGVIPDVVFPSRIDAYDIGEDMLENPLEYDTIPKVKYSLYDKAPLPADELRNRSKARVEKEVEFQYLTEDIKRYKDQIAKNTISLNEKERLDENEKLKERRKARNEERKKRIAALGAAGKDAYKMFKLTLDNVDKPELTPETANEEQSTGMRMAKDEDDDGDVDKPLFPNDLEPIKAESLHVLEDLISLHYAPRTAAAEPQPK